MKLERFIEASLTYQKHFSDRDIALIEIIFNARTGDNIPYYKMNDNGDGDRLMDELVQILKDGQTNGDFRSFDIDVMANMIQGAIGEYMFNKEVDLQTYTKELVKNINITVGKG